MKTLPTDYIELTREQGEALWWACDAWFDHCARLLAEPAPTVDRPLLAACVVAGNALRASLQTAGVDRTIERFARSDAEAVARLVTSVAAMDDDFLDAEWDSSRWSSRDEWDEARMQSPYCGRRTPGRIMHSILQDASCTPYSRTHV